MSDIETLEGWRRDMRRLGDEIRVRLHLAGMEARSAWEKLEPRLEAFERKAEEAGEELADELEDLAKSIKAQLEALRDRMRE